MVRDPKFEVFASDIDREVIEYAKANADRAGVLSNMKIFEQDAMRLDVHVRLVGTKKLV